MNTDFKDKVKEALMDLAKEHKGDFTTLGWSGGGLGGATATIGGVLTGGNATDILFVNPSAVLSQSAALTWNDSTHTLQIGDTSGSVGTVNITDGAADVIKMIASATGSWKYLDIHPTALTVQSDGWGNLGINVDIQTQGTHTTSTLYGSRTFISNNSSGTATDITAGIFNADNHGIDNGAGDAINLFGLIGTAYNSGTGTVTFQYGGYFQSGGDTLGGTVTNDHTLYVNSPANTATLTHHYGLFFNEQNYGPDAWTIDAGSSTAPSRFGGSVTVQNPTLAQFTIKNSAGNGVHQFYFDSSFGGGAIDYEQFDGNGRGGIDLFTTTTDREITLYEPSVGNGPIVNLNGSNGNNAAVTINQTDVGVNSYTIDALLSTAPSRFGGMITIEKDAIGVTPTDGLVLQNTTAAANNAQQFSPALHLKGAGWKTGLGGASRSVDWIIENEPVQGNVSPTSNLNFLLSIGGGAYTSKAMLNSFGTLTLPNNLELGSGSVNTAGTIFFGSDGSTQIGSGLANSRSAFFISGMDIVFGTDNSNDIGTASGTPLRPRSIYAGTNVQSPAFTLGTGGPTWTTGAGSPEGAVTAPVGSLYSNTTGGASTTLYVKESGAGNTGWKAAQTA